MPVIRMENRLADMSGADGGASSSATIGVGQLVLVPDGSSNLPASRRSGAFNRQDSVISSGQLVAPDLGQPDRERAIAVVVRGDEELARLGREQLVALLQVGAADQQRVVQLMNGMMSCLRIWKPG